MRDRIDFITNDFLGFSRSQKLLREAEHLYHEYCERFPNALLGATGSRGMLGTPPIVQELEKKICQYHGVESALFSHSGYTANIGLCSHIGPSDIVLWDEAVHVSITSFWRATNCHISFHHNDLNHLESLLQSYRGWKGRLFIFVSSVYSFLGTFAPLESLLKLADYYHAHLIVDEAHAMGLFGEGGRGFCYHLGYEHFYAVVVTFSKAMGCMGAAILTSESVKRDLVHHISPIIYSTGVSPFVITSIDAAYSFLAREGKQARMQLQTLIDYFLTKYPYGTRGAVQPLALHGVSSEIIKKYLEDRYIDIGLIRSDPSRLRINIHAYNTCTEIDILIQCLTETGLLKEGGDRVYVHNDLYF